MLKDSLHNIDAKAKTPYHALQDNSLPPLPISPNTDDTLATLDSFIIAPLQAAEQFFASHGWYLKPLLHVYIDSSLFNIRFPILRLDPY